MKAHTSEEIDRAASLSAIAFEVYRKTTAARRAALLKAIGQGIDANRNRLAEVAQRETALDRDRLQSEITRTVNQCYLFSELLQEGSWVRAIIDTAEPFRKPLPKPDLRQLQVALGPVAVFGASNFPFAYSVCGGDTVAALAAGCPVIYKVNPGHPDTSDEVAAIMKREVEKHEFHHGTFELIHGANVEAGMRLIMHPAIKAVGFTGSLKGGRALFDAAAKREEPIPVYAEMGSTNPVFILPEILEQKGAEIAKALAASNTSSMGQFCTNPGIMIKAQGDAARSFDAIFSEQAANITPAHMLNEGISLAFHKSVASVSGRHNVSVLTAPSKEEEQKTGAYVFQTTASAFLSDASLWEEMFGPASIQVTAGTKEEFMSIARALPGQITASVWGTDNDFVEFHDLLEYLQLKAGRIIINGVPTGVEVTHAMNHGGPYPATTDSKFTSVGTQSIYRFTRPVCFQNYPQHLLPDELKDSNPQGIVRMVNGRLIKGSFS